MHVERELQELRERLAQVEQWKRRREEIDHELAQVWVANADGDGCDKPLEPPPYAEKEGSGEVTAEVEPEVEPEVGVKPAEVELVDSQ